MGLTLKEALCSWPEKGVVWVFLRFSLLTVTKIDRRERY